LYKTCKQVICFLLNVVNKNKQKHFHNEVSIPEHITRLSRYVTNEKSRCIIKASSSLAMFLNYHSPKITSPRVIHIDLTRHIISLRHSFLCLTLCYVSTCVLGYYFIMDVLIACLAFVSDLLLFSSFGPYAIYIYAGNFSSK